MIDLGGTASGIGLIQRRITLKDNEFDQFIQNISLSKTTMSKDQEQINTWEEYFKLFDNPKGLEDFMADRE